MSLFKKPSRNIRRREINNDDDESDTIENEPRKIQNHDRNGNSHGKVIKKALLSFGEEWSEGDDGEVFKVKKSAQSKKIRKQFDKEKHKIKDPAQKKSEVKKSFDEFITEDNVTIKIKNPIAGATDPKVLSGRSAEMAGYESSESDSESSGALQSHHKFARPDRVKMLLKSGKIPDATLIHEARKRRQRYRELGNFGDFVPVNEFPVESATANETRNRSESMSRLVREDEEEESGEEEEERMTMSGIVSFAADRQKRKEGLDSFINTSDVDDEDNDAKNEEAEWENQQIRKGVTDAQLAAVQQESYYMQQYMNQSQSISAMGVPAYAEGSPTSVAAVVESTPTVFPPLPVEQTSNIVDAVDPRNVANKLRERLTSIKENKQRRDNELSRLTEEMETLKSDLESGRALVSELTKHFQFYQNLRGYVTDLVECLDEKLPLIDSLEHRLIAMYQKRNTELASRRRQDVKDQMEDLTSTSRVVREKEEDRVRRRAEREGRRIRRSKKRTLCETIGHLDGWSSDDEVTEMAAAAHRTNKRLFMKLPGFWKTAQFRATTCKKIFQNPVIIESDASRIFDDVVEEFVTVDSILRRFSSWKMIDKTAYTEAYANICLPKLLAPIVRMNIIFWNPLCKIEDDRIADNIEEFDWLKSAMMYCAEKAETEDSLRDDADLQLVPRLLENVLIPKLQKLVEADWEPLSSRQTDGLLNTVKVMVRYPFIGPLSKHLDSLLRAVLDKMQNAIDNDLFIPMFPKQILDTGSLNVFFQRQFANSLKLYANLLKWEGLLHDRQLAELSNRSLLNRYLLMAIRTLQPLDAANKSLLVINYLPNSWLKDDRVKAENLHLNQFFNNMKDLIKKIDINNPHGKEAIEKLTQIVKQFESTS